METTAPTPAVRELQAWFEHERETNGLVEMTFCPGSDREISVEETATVALAMIKHARG